MQEIKCPQCGKIFTIDESSYAAIVKQVRDREFDRELSSRTDTAVKLAEAKKNQVIASLEGQLDAQKKSLEAEKQQELTAAAARSDQMIAALRQQLDRAEAEKELAVTRTAREKDEEQHEKETQIVQLKGQIAAMESAFSLKEKQLREDQDHLLRIKDEEIAYYKDMKTRLSTKMVGESLEQHCEIEFNSVRTRSYPLAYFEKDNDAKSGSKGDFIFRDYDQDGTEYISIMFEMKNEMDETATKHKNEDFFKKLDKDRREKGCEYAVLVTLLEADSEFYNQGIVDVSYRYPKMYVVRPQFFMTLISLLCNASRNSLQVRRELAVARRQNYAAEKFSEQLNDFKSRFSKDFKLASDRFGDAIDEIDKSIAALQKVRDNLVLSEKHLRHANDKADALTIKQLTKDNPEMRQAFEDAGVEV